MVSGQSLFLLFFKGEIQRNYYSSFIFSPLLSAVGPAIAGIQMRERKNQGGQENFDSGIASRSGENRTSFRHRRNSNNHSR